MMKRNLLLFSMLFFLSGHVAAEESVDDLLQKMQAVQANPSELKAYVNQGKERGRLCFSCHGKDGNSKREYIPNLASQNAAYLFLQFEHFGNGVRKDYVMSKLANQLTGDERVAIALYFAEKTIRTRDNTVEASEDGEHVYNSTCFVCHGQSGHGNQQYPRIAGQPMEYLTTTLTKFKANDPDRKNSPMVAVVKNLSDSDIQAVATYITNMK